MKFLVGYSGFVGSNILKNMDFDGLFNHLNIADAFGKCPDLLIYAGVSADKFLSNTNEQKDLDSVMVAYQNIVKISPKKLVLISSIDVNQCTKNVDETVFGDLDKMNAYGKNRLKLELKIRETFPDALIVRLPALFGQNLKKNFVYDILNPIPKTLDKTRYENFCADSVIKNSYIEQPNGFFNISISADKEKLKKSLENFNFSSLCFTDSRAKFQFYNLANLDKDILIALDNNLKTLNITSEPVSANEISMYCLDKPFNNLLNRPVPDYDVKSVNCKLYGGKNGYLYQKQEVLQDLKYFIMQQKIKFSVSNLCFSSDNLKHVLPLMRKYGYCSFEIAPTKVVQFPPYDKVDALIDWANKLKRDFDISICSIQSMWFGVNKTMFGENADLDFLLQYTKKCIDCASALGASNIVFGNPKSRNIINEGDVEKAKEFFVNLNDYCLDKGVNVSIEPNPAIYGTNFLNDTKSAFEFVKSLDCSHIKVNLDFGTIIANDENFDVVKSNINLIGHIHISEPMLALIKPSSKHNELADLLLKNGYCGYVSIEMAEQKIDDLAKTMQYVKDVFTKEK